jgi:YD repeat-containing protein
MSFISRVVDETRASNNVIEYHYDAYRLVEVRHPGHAGGPHRVYRYDYDHGNLTSATEPFGSPLHCAYDARNALIRLQDTDGAVKLLFGRDRAGRLSSVTDSSWQDPSRTFQFVRQDGALVDNLYRIDGPSGLMTRFTYDANRRIMETIAERGGTTICTYGYAYRADGLLGGSTGEHVGEYVYDGMKRLIKETDTGVASAYDATGNRLWRNAFEPPSNQVNSYDSDNRLTRTPSDDTTYVYDENGNLLIRQPMVGEVTHYKYDSANRLRQVERGELHVSYLYDINGRVLERVRNSAGTTSRVRYWHANRAILAVLDASELASTIYTRTDDGRLLRRRGTNPLRPTPAALNPSADQTTLNTYLQQIASPLIKDGNLQNVGLQPSAVPRTTGTSVAITVVYGLGNKLFLGSSFFGVSFPTQVSVTETMTSE